MYVIEEMQMEIERLRRVILNASLTLKELGYPILANDLLRKAEGLDSGKEYGYSEAVNPNPMVENV